MKLQGQGICLPDRVSSYSGNNDFKWKKEPCLSAESLLNTLQPWLSAKRFDVICGNIEKFVDHCIAIERTSFQNVKNKITPGKMKKKRNRL